MSKLGNKVLASLNFVAAILFLVLAGGDYGRRHIWMFAVLQQDFTLRGLPVDETEKDVEGRPLVNLIGKRMRDQLFTGLSEPQKTQKAEVDRRFKALRAEIDAAPDPAAKKTLIANALMPLTRTWGQRDELRRKISDPNVSVDALLAADGPFEAAFKEAMEGKTVAEAELGSGERRQAIAHLLFNLSDKPEDQMRTLAVVGRRAYALEADSQATALANMIPLAQHALDADLAGFELDHKYFVGQIVLLAERVRRLEEILQTQTLSAQKHATLLADRKADVQGVRGEIDAAKKATVVALKGQSGLEEALFRAHRAIAAAGDKNQQLLRQIDAVEFGR